MMLMAGPEKRKAVAGPIPAPSCPQPCDPIYQPHGECSDAWKWLIEISGMQAVSHKRIFPPPERYSSSSSLVGSDKALKILMRKSETVF
jgi:hypothetical protein